ncbi:sensor histidine kinase [Streptomyces sp. NPDC059209]|uniref:sensor histidine kinase n=1 Tax=Streptomyces sp. NPDC059209 TaxID=3346769 RepID=UPI00368F680B
MTTTGAHEEAEGLTTRGFWWWTRRRSVVLDVGLAVVSALECAFEGIRFAGSAQLPVALGVVFGVLVGSVLLLRRRWPMTVVLVSVAVTPAEMGVLLAIVGLYTLAASDAPRRIIGALAGMSLVGTLIVVFVRTRQDVSGVDIDSARWYIPLIAVFMALSMSLPPVLLGLYVGARRRLMESLRERADSLEQELSLLADRAEQRAEWARTEERTRIAREMHDVVAHRVSLMVVHAAALQAVALKDPPKAVKNAALVGDMGRQALTELREMLGVLRAGEQQAARKVADAGSGADRSTVPLASVGVAITFDPGMGDIEALVGQSRDAGMVVELAVQGVTRAYAPEVEQTAYRVVQEALTNVHKHAAGSKVMVRLAHREAEIAMQVENGPSYGAADAGLPSGGNGLVGMRERVLALGGVFVSGETDAGGFRVSAVLPYRDAA